MGIESLPEILSLNKARRCRLSKSQLVPNGAKYCWASIIPLALLHGEGHQ